MTHPPHQPSSGASSRDLVSASDLDRWADTPKSKAAFPELIRRLLAQTPGVTNIEMRAHGGVSAPGWDGSAHSIGSAYLPAGDLRFELGTNKRASDKAQSDYSKRVSELGDDVDKYVYVFVTPRSWAGGQKWADERRQEHQFADVRVMDAHTLEGWLQNTPYVHYWVSEDLGREPDDARTLEAWWKRFQSGLNIEVPDRFFLAGRKNQASDLLSALAQDSPSQPASVQSTCPEDVLAFAFAALKNQPDLIERAVVVTGAGAWSRLVESAEPLILIPRYADPDAGIRDALSRGHHVLTVVDSATEYSREQATVVLPQVGRQEAEDTLQKANDNPRASIAMAALARRSMTGFIRSISLNPVKRIPEWLSDGETRDILSALVLVGAWECGNPRDEGHVESLVGASMNNVTVLLKSLRHSGDAPLVRSGEIWRLTDPQDAARLLLPELGDDTVRRWGTFVDGVVLAPDPYRGMSEGERFRAQLRHKEPKMSATLCKHAARGLILAAVWSDQLAPTVDSIVSSLLARAFRDQTCETLECVARVFPELAEAAPNLFLDAIENDLRQDSPLVRTLFLECDGTAVGAGSHHTELLWAMEVLCLSPEYYARAVMVLAALAAIDPGGQYGYRPIQSLMYVAAAPWAWGTNNVDKKARVVQEISRRYPDVGWELVRGMSQPQTFLVGHNGPLYRDWGSSSSEIGYDEFSQFVTTLAESMLEMAGSEPGRWVTLVGEICEFYASVRSMILERLADVVESCRWDAESSMSVHSALVRQMQHQMSRVSAASSMNDDDSSNVARMKEIACVLIDENSPRADVYLFYSDHCVVVDGLRYCDDGFGEVLNDARRRAVERVARMGNDALGYLVEHVERPDLVGAYLARMHDIEDRDVIKWIDGSSEALREAARAFAWNRLNVRGFAWLSEILEAPGLSREGRAQLVGEVPMRRDWWTQVAKLDNDLISEYWARADYHGVSSEESVEAVEMLLSHAHPWRALVILNRFIHDRPTSDTNQVLRVLNRLVGSPSSDEVGDCRYKVTNVLEWLETAVVDQAELAQLELCLFDCFGECRRPNALYEVLGSNPTRFVELTRLAHPAEGVSPEGVLEVPSVQRSLAWNVLYKWPLIPGIKDDGKVDADVLSRWVHECRRQLGEFGMERRGDEEIGAVLARSPQGDDGVWPAEAVRSILEEVSGDGIVCGLVRGAVNRRGVSSRGMYEGGTQERELARTYRGDAQRVELRWPRTAAVLRSLASFYESLAKDTDKRDEQFADEGP